MRTSSLQTATSPSSGPAARWTASSLVLASKAAWRDYRGAKSLAERRHHMWLFALYLSAVVLPGGALLILLRWLWLRTHM